MARQFWLEVITLVVVGLVLGSRGSRKGKSYFAETNSSFTFFLPYRRRTDFRLTVKNEVVGVTLSHGDGLKRWLQTYR